MLPAGLRGARNSRERAKMRGYFTLAHSRPHSTTKNSPRIRDLVNDSDTDSPLLARKHNPAVSIMLDWRAHLLDPRLCLCNHESVSDGGPLDPPRITQMKTEDLSTLLDERIEQLRKSLQNYPEYKELRRLEEFQGSMLEIRTSLVEQRKAPKEKPTPRYIVILHETRQILEELREPVSVSTIYDLLLQRGIKIPGTNPRNNLSARLSNARDQFVSGPDGWSLRQETAQPRANGPDAPQQSAEEGTG